MPLLLLLLSTLVKLLSLLSWPTDLMRLSTFRVVLHTWYHGLAGLGIVEQDHRLEE